MRDKEGMNWDGGRGRGREGFGWEGGRGRGREGRGRVERGAMRWLLLDVLRDEPRHGYEIMKTIEQRSNGKYAPSPGTVYPTLQLLEDEGLIRADQQADRRVFCLSEAGRAELDKAAERIEMVWKRFTAPPAPDALRQEMEFLHDELRAIHRTIHGSLDEAVENGNREAVRNMRRLIQRQHEEIRDFISGAADEVAAPKDAPGGAPD